MKRTALFMAVCLGLAALTGCSGTADSPAPADTVVPTGEDLPDTPPLVATQGGAAAAEELLHVTIESVEVSAADLAAQDYTVPVMVTLDKNPGITYSEWGLYVDKTCNFTANSSKLAYGTVYHINEEKKFLWTAWMSTELRDDAGELLELQVKLPMDAAPGSTYAITYADVSQANAPHIWTGDNNDWVAQNAVGWTDGGITVVE